MSKLTPLIIPVLPETMRTLSEIALATGMSVEMVASSAVNGFLANEAGKVHLVNLMRGALTIFAAEKAVEDV